MLAGNGHARRIRTLATVALALAISVAGRRDAGAREVLSFDQISLEDGLSQSVVLCIRQDSKGFLWFGTEDGLNRYDGFEFTVYRHDPADPNSLGYNTVTEVFEDHAGAIWIGSFNGGLTRHQPATGRWQAFRHDPRAPGSLPDNDVNAIAEDADRAIWVATNGGLARYDRPTGRFVTYRHDPDDPASLPADAVTVLLVDDGGRLWLGSRAGLARVRQSPAGVRFETVIAGTAVRALLQDRAGTIWCGTLGEGVWQLDPGGNRLGRHTTAEGLSSDGVVALAEDGAGMIWLGTADSGLNRLDPRSGSVSVYRHDPGRATSLAADEVRSVAVDASGVLWVGTYGRGLSCTPVENEAFGLVRFDGAGPAQARNFVWALCEDGRGDVWVGTHGGGLYLLDAAGGRLASYRHDADDATSLTHDIVRTVMEDRRGRIWIGTHGGGLDRLDRTTGRFTHFRHDPDDPVSLAIDALRCTYEDRGGLIWVGTYGAGLDCLDPRTGIFTHYPPDPADPGALSHAFVRTVHESPGEAGRVLWVGTDGGGLARLDRTTGTFTRFRHDPDDPRSLSEDHVFSIHETADGSLWIGTYAGGLNRFDRAAGTFAHFTTRDGLPSNAIYGILEDDTGYLWLSTNHGLACFDPRDGSCKNYDVRDGLQSNEFNGGAYHRGRSGRFYFGGIGGFNAFRPAAIRDNPNPPAVVLTDFQVASRSVVPGDVLDGRVTLDRPIAYARTIDLSYRQKVIAFEFAALHFVAPRQNRYAIMMDGFDDDWNHVGNRSHATYTALPPGRYTFRVKAGNNDGVWNETGAAVKIVIHPPFWRTAWFRGLVGLAIAGLLLGAHALRTRAIRVRNLRLSREVESRKRAEQATQQALTAERETGRLKSQFLANVSHEFRTPMNGIIGMTELTLATQLTPEQHENLTIVKASADRLQEIMDTILDFSRIEAGEVASTRQELASRDLLDGAVEDARAAAREKNLDFAVELAPDVPPRLAGDVAGLQQVIRQVAGNAVEFTERGGVAVAATWLPDTRNRGRLRCTVRDTGVGISPDAIATIFESFRQADGSYTRVHGGTGIGLAMCRRLLELMDGSIGVESEVGRGSTFRFDAPFTVVEAAAAPPVVTASTAAPAPAAPASPLRVLLVEDVVINQKVATRMLEKAGHSVTVAENGQVALATLGAQEFDVVLMDIQMPVMNGFEATARIRAAAPPLCDLPIVALTAHTLDEDREKCLAAGMDGYVAKPVKAPELLAAIAGALERETEPVPAGPAR